MMIEPTETEPKETLDAFAAAMLRIAERVKTDPASVRDAPKHAPLRRLDEVGAARKPVLRYRAPDSSQGRNPLQPPSAAGAER
jgi:glycine dehydrogenase subunit 2